MDQLTLPLEVTYSQTLPLHYGCYVYRCWTSDGECAYVGKSIHVIRRLRDHVTVAWWATVSYVDVATLPDMDAAHAEEVSQIRHWQPANNSDHNRMWVRKSQKPPPTHCPQKHEYTPENTLYNARGSKICRECKNARARAAPKKGIARGERQGSAKLTGWAVADISRRHALGASISSLARDYGVSRITVRRVIEGRTWVHVKRGDAA